MTNFKNACGLFLGLGMLMTGGVVAGEMKIEADKGTLVVEYGDGKSDYELNVEIPAHCPNTQVKQTFTQGTLRLVHVGAICSEGATMTVKLSQSMSVTAVLGAGVLELNSAKEVLEKSGEVKLRVDAGIVRTKLIAKKKINSWAGEEAIYSNDSGPYSRKISLFVNSGVLNF